MFIDDERMPGHLRMAVGTVASVPAPPLLQATPPAVAVACMAPGITMIGLGVWSIWRVSRRA